jgi:TatD DNase family protein
MAAHLGTDVSLLAAQIASNTELVYGRWDAEPVTARHDNLPPDARPLGGLA